MWDGSRSCLPVALFRQRVNPSCDGPVSGEAELAKRGSLDLEFNYNDRKHKNLSLKIFAPIGLMLAQPLKTLLILAVTDF